MAKSCGISTDHRNDFSEPPLHQRNLKLPPQKKLATTNAASDANCTQEKGEFQDKKKEERHHCKKTSQGLLQLGAKVSTGLGLGITPKRLKQINISFQRKRPNQQEMLGVLWLFY